MTHTKRIVQAGLSLNNASKILIMLHGRGATAHDILSLTNNLEVDDFHIVAPQANNNRWYPNSFLHPIYQNQPDLNSALDLLWNLTVDYEKEGFGREKIYLLGFSQGACLALEFAAQNAQKWGGIIAFTGGLIGDVLVESRYKGNFEGTKVYMGTSDNDPHIPLIRSKETEGILKKLGAEVKLEVFAGMGHIVNRREIDEANLLLKG
jgi:phospholipase/carboxylesterase